MKKEISKMKNTFLLAYLFFIIIMLNVLFLVKNFESKK